MPLSETGSSPSDLVAIASDSRPSLDPSRPSSLMPNYEQLRNMWPFPIGDVDHPPLPRFVDRGLNLDRDETDSDKDDDQSDGEYTTSAASKKRKAPRRGKANKPKVARQGTFAPACFLVRCLPYGCSFLSRAVLIVTRFILLSLCSPSSRSVVLDQRRPVLWSPLAGSCSRIPGRAWSREGLQQGLRHPLRPLDQKACR